MIQWVTVEEANRLITDHQVIVWDLRERWEVYDGRLPVANIMPHTELGPRLDPCGCFNPLKTGKTTPLLLYSDGDDTTRHAAQFLEQKGFTNLRCMKGGIQAWMRHGYSIKKGD